jgi:hypothetical protein
MIIRKILAIPFVLVGLWTSLVAKIIIGNDKIYVAWLQEIAHALIHPFHKHKV